MPKLQTYHLVVVFWHWLVSFPWWWCDVVWCHVVGCKVRCINVIGCEVTRDEAMWLVARCHVMSCHVMWFHVMWRGRRYVQSCNVTSGDVMSSDVGADAFCIQKRSKTHHFGLRLSPKFSWNFTKYYPCHENYARLLQNWQLRISVTLILSYSTVNYSIVSYSTVNYSTVSYSTLSDFFVWVIKKFEYQMFSN